MAVTDNISIDESAGHLTIETLEVTDEELVEFISSYDESEQADVVSEALTIGMKTMQLMDTSQDVEYVERRLGDLEDELTDQVESFQEELDQKVGDDGDLQEALDEYIGEEGTLQERIEAAFDEDGPFTERLDKELGEEGGRIRDALDVDDEDSPIYRLEQRLSDEVDYLREKIVAEAAAEEVRGQTYLKGGDFEDDVEEILNEIVRQTPNNVEYTGETTGAMGRDVGDFVVTLADTGQRLAIEAKTESYSVNDIQSEMEDALQNREADYGIFVTDTLANLPRTKTGWFHEFPEYNTVVVAMSEVDDEEIEPGYLRIAFNWARLRAVQEYADVGSDFDAEAVTADLSNVEDQIGRFKTIRGQCTEIKKSRERIEATLREIEDNIQSSLASIEAELMKAEAE